MGIAERNRHANMKKFENIESNDEMRYESMPLAPERSLDKVYGTENLTPPGVKDSAPAYAAAYHDMFPTNCA